MIVGFHKSDYKYLCSVLGDTVYCGTNLPTFVSLKLTQQVFFNVDQYVLGLGCYFSEDNNLHLKLFYLLSFFLFLAITFKPLFYHARKTVYVATIWRLTPSVRSWHSTSFSEFITYTYSPLTGNNLLYHTPVRKATYKTFWWVLWYH